MPDGATKALSLLETALKMESDYALVHGFASWAHEIICARSGARPMLRSFMGRDDAIALSLGGFCPGPSRAQPRSGARSLRSIAPHLNHAALIPGYRGFESLPLRQPVRY